MITQLYLLKTLSGLHCGVGEGKNDIDRPTARDPVTGYPQAPGSSFRGVLREHYFNKDKILARRVFGPASADVMIDDPASSVSIGDARLVCLPVRTNQGTFAYLTSPVALAFFADDLRRTGADSARLGSLAPPKDKSLLAGGGTRPQIAVTSNTALRNGVDPVLLEEFDLIVNNDWGTVADNWAKAIVDLWGNCPAFCKELFCPRFAIVCDDVFDFLCETALPVVTRNSVDASGIVKDKALWTEEIVSSEAIFSGLLHAEPSRSADVSQRLTAAEVMEFMTTKAPRELQLGGKASVGRGVLSLCFPKPLPAPFTGSP